MTIQQLQQHLISNKLYVNVDENETHFIIYIEWGDWKHGHRFLQYLMANLNFTLDKREITDSDDSDCFSATYYYNKNN